MHHNVSPDAQATFDDAKHGKLRFLDPAMGNAWDVGSKLIVVGTFWGIIHGLMIALGNHVRQFDL